MAKKIVKQVPAVAAVAAPVAAPVAKVTRAASRVVAKGKWSGATAMAVAALVPSKENRAVARPAAFAALAPLFCGGVTEKAREGAVRALRAILKAEGGVFDPLFAGGWGAMQVAGLADWADGGFWLAAELAAEKAIGGEKGGEVARKIRERSASAGGERLAAHVGDVLGGLAPEIAKAWAVARLRTEKAAAGVAVKAAAAVKAA